MTPEYCPGCGHKMLPYDYSCLVCGYTEIYSHCDMNPFDEFGDEFDLDNNQFFDDDF